MDDYRNSYLDRAIAAIVLIVFLVALFYAVMIIGQFWAFFRWFFCVVVVILAVWIVIMLFNIIWRYNAKTQVILEKKGVPYQLSEKTGWQKLVIHSYENAEQHTDYNDYFQSYDEE